MLSVQELAELLTRKLVGIAHKARKVAPSLRDDFECGYHNLIIRLGFRFRIGWTSERNFEIDPPAKTSDMIEQTSLARTIAELREELLRDEQKDRKLPEEYQAPGYFQGKQQALSDIARELGLDEG